LIAVLVAFTSGVSYGEEQPPGGKYGKLSDALIHNKNTGIGFFEPPKEVLVNYKMLKSDFQLYNGMITFRLDGTQRNIHLGMWSVGLWTRTGIEPVDSDW
jgi:hypothetical protein